MRVGVFNFLMIVTQIFMCVAFVYVSCQSAETEYCKRQQEKYFRIYRHYRDDIKEVEQKRNIINPENDELMKEGARIAENTIRHYSFKNDTQYLIIKALEATFTNNSNRNQKYKAFLDFIFKEQTGSIERTEELMTKILKQLKNKDKRWITFDEYKEKKNEDDCF